METTAQILTRPLSIELDRIDSLSRIHPLIEITEGHAREFARNWCRELAARYQLGHGFTTLSTDQGLFRYTGFGLEWQRVRGKRSIRGIIQDTGKNGLATLLTKPWRALNDQGTPSAVYADLAELIEQTGDSVQAAF